MYLTAIGDAGRRGRAEEAPGVVVEQVVGASVKGKVAVGLVQVGIDGAPAHARREGNMPECQ